MNRDNQSPPHGRDPLSGLTTTPLPAAAVEHSIEMIQHLSRSLCHEFNNALSSIMGYSQLVMRNPNDKELLGRAMDVNLRASLRLSALTRRLGWFAGEGHNTAWGEEDLVELASDCAELFRPEAEHWQIGITVEDRPPVRIWHSPVKLRLALLELLRNAMEALQTLPEGEERKITLRFRETEASVCLLVEDTGPGLDLSRSAHPEIPFSGTKDILGGGEDTRTRGLGLSIVQTLLREHDGGFRIASRPEGGTSAELTLPKSEAVRARRKRLFVIDDDEAIRLIFSEFLERDGYEVTLFDRAEPALKLFTKGEKRPDLILLDQMMPGLSGLEMMETLASFSELPPVILITAARDPELGRAALELGVCEVVAKPVRRAQLRALVRRHLGESLFGSDIMVMDRPERTEIPPRVLVVESDALTRDTVAMALQRAGFFVTAVEAGSAGLAEAEAEEFDLILFDPLLHDSDGVAAMKRVRAAAPYTPLLLLADPAGTAQTRRALKAGALHAVAKPLDVHGVVDTVVRVLALFREE